MLFLVFHGPVPVFCYNNSFQINVHALSSCRYEFDKEHFKMFTKKNLHSILARKTILLKEAFYGSE